MSKNAARTLKTVARQAKQRIKENFWEGYRIERAARIEIAKQNGVNEQEAERFLSQEIERKIRGEQQTDAFYERVKAMLLSEGEVSDAIGRLTDYALYETLSYAEKQRYTLALSEKYLRALERFKRECVFFATEEKYL
jgi:hypothetical protein